VRSPRARPAPPARRRSARSAVRVHPRRPRSVGRWRPCSRQLRWRASSGEVDLGVDDPGLLGQRPLDAGGARTARHALDLQGVLGGRCGFLRQLELVAGLGDRGLQIGEVDGFVHADPGEAGGEVHLGVEHARLLLEGALHPRGARPARHARDGQVDFGGGGVVLGGHGVLVGAAMRGVGIAAGAFAGIARWWSRYVVGRVSAAAVLAEGGRFIRRPPPSPSLRCDGRALCMDPASGERGQPTTSRSWTRRSSWALSATTTVEVLISTAPRAIGSTNPQGTSTPAASGIATRL
jgi:hypothetical protein